MPKLRSSAGDCSNNGKNLGKKFLSDARTLRIWTVQCSVGNSNIQKAYMEKQCKNHLLPGVMVTVAVTIKFVREACKIPDLYTARVGCQTLFSGSVEETLTTFEILIDISRSSPTSGHLALPR